MPYLLAPAFSWPAFLGLIATAWIRFSQLAVVRLYSGLQNLCFRAGLPLPSQESQPRAEASLEASCTAVMQRWARRLASSWPWARSR